MREQQVRYFITRRQARAAQWSDMHQEDSGRKEALKANQRPGGRASPLFMPPLLSVLLTPQASHRAKTQNSSHASHDWLSFVREEFSQSLSSLSLPISTLVPWPTSCRRIRHLAQPIMNIYEGAAVTTFHALDAQGLHVARERNKGPFIKDVRKIFGILDPLPPFWLDL